MQLDDPGPGRPASLRQRLGAAACLLLVGSVPAAAQTGTLADTAAVPPKWQLDTSALIYGEQNRADVVEPLGRITRLFPSGRQLSAQFTIDAITGASPTGQLPSGQVQTTTSASGSTSTTPANAIPTHPFRDLRGALDLEALQPVGSLVNLSASTHLSREKDYQSLGASGRLSVDLMGRLLTLTVGAGVNRDGVFPVGGSPLPLSDGTERFSGTRHKDVTTGLVGLSRVMSRRWLLGITGSHIEERGYLTDPYKTVSLVDSTGELAGMITERRPSRRTRNDVLTSSVVHLDTDVLYLNHRFYWDDWGVRSNTVDVKVRHDLTDDSWVQPHLRFYEQTRAQFFVFGLIHGPPAGSDVSADDRLGPLRTVTLGATYGFRVPGTPGEFTVRGEYLYQWLGGPVAVGPVRSLPGTSIGSLLGGYSVRF